MIAFIILHYKNLEDTMECIESIMALKTNKQLEIIVVDNHTLDEQGIITLQRYPIHLIPLDNNMGFAKANNIGCQYAIKNFHPDFLVVSNNDIVIEDEAFINKVYQADEKLHFDLLGPKIKTNSGQSVNPFPVYKTKEEVKYQIQKTKKLIKIYKNIILRNLLKYYLKIKSILKIQHFVTNGEKLEYQVALHGCFIIFSKHYYEQYQDVFYNETFLYHEEEFLYQRILHNHLISIYDPEIEIYHKEGASLNYQYQNKEYSKLVFKNKEILKSLMLLEKEMDQYESSEANAK